jgi:hypothetical protein
LLRKRMKLAGMTPAALSRKLSVSSVTVGRYFKSSSLQSGILWNAGMVLKHNFFAEMGKYMPAPFHDVDVEKTSSDFQALLNGKDAELAARDQQIKDLEKELAIYKAIVMRS